jgi:prepilin-type N-terminal cleavage/methylation domain-containing protein
VGSNHRARRAFTLVEVLSALVLLAILASTAAPTVSRAARRYAAWSAGHELRSDLVVARTRAVLDGATVRVVVDTLRARYVVIAASGDTLRSRALGSALLIRTTAWRQEILFTSRGTSSLYSTTWVGVAGDPDARWHGARVAPTGAVTSM